MDAAVEVKGASFSWDAPPPEREEKKMRRKNKTITNAQPAATAESPQEPFKLRDITITIPRGQLVAVVGQVGCGKTSLLQGIIGEMRRTGGSVKFGGSVGYCPQSAWIQVGTDYVSAAFLTFSQNATIRENICFGRAFDEGRYWTAIKNSCLEPDLEMLPHGDMTEVGEKVGLFFLQRGSG